MLQPATLLKLYFEVGKKKHQTTDSVFNTNAYFWGGVGQGRLGEGGGKYLLIII